MTNTIMLDEDAMKFSSNEAFSLSINLAKDRYVRFAQNLFYSFDEAMKKLYEHTIVEGYRIVHKTTSTTITVFIYPNVDKDMVEGLIKTIFTEPYDEAEVTNIFIELMEGVARW